MADASVTVGGFKWVGSFTTVDLIAASTNALNGALLARHPDHCKQFTIGLPVLACLLLALVGPTAGRWLVDVSSGVTPKQFIKGKWFIATASLAGAVWIVVYWTGAGAWWAAGIAFAVGYTFRTLALFRGWEEPLPEEAKGVVIHGEGRPLLGRKLKGKVQARVARPRGARRRARRGGICSVTSPHG